MKKPTELERLYEDRNMLEQQIEADNDELRVRGDDMLQEEVDYFETAIQAAENELWCINRYIEELEDDGA